MIPSEQQQTLVAAALTARGHAYAKYSDYAVGAALLSDAGQIYSGCNVENASYGLTICAERVALFNAVSTGVKNFQGLAIATADGAAPCGACRQVLAEFCDDLPILLVKVDDPPAVQTTTLATLLPQRFGPGQKTSWQHGG